MVTGKQCRSCYNDQACRVVRLVYFSASETIDICATAWVLVYTSADVDSEDAWWIAREVNRHVLLPCQPYAKSAIKPSNRNESSLPTPSLQTVLLPCTSPRCTLAPPFPTCVRSCHQHVDLERCVEQCTFPRVCSQRTKRRPSLSGSASRPSHGWTFMVAKSRPTSFTTDLQF